MVSPWFSGVGCGVIAIWVWVVLVVGCAGHETGFTKQHLAKLRQETRQLFDHGWNSYMELAYPADELTPLSCKPYGASGDVYEIHRNDVMGNYSVTFLDSITTFAVMNDVENFTKYINKLETDLDFDKDSTVQVFETAIRALGSLLSSHLYAIDMFKIPDYNGFLLEKAKDLGERLLASYTHLKGTTIPIARVNLKKGVKGIPRKLKEQTCTSGVTTPMLEMTMLSILTNDTRFEYYSRKAFNDIWNSRTDLDLVPMTLSPISSEWLDMVSGVGASIDSFYEYALKGSILFNDDKLYSVWEKSFKSLMIHSKFSSFFTNVNSATGSIISPWIDALGAFFPGLLVLGGAVDLASEVYAPYMKLWNIYNGIPERWDFVEPVQKKPSKTKFEPVSLEWYPLRPEFIESTYYLYQATKDPMYLRIGENVLNDFKTIFKTECGFAGYRDVRNGELQDRMESFVLSETFMYLYLLFDEKNLINSNENLIFSTEGHPMWIPKGVLRQYQYHKANDDEFNRKNMIKSSSSSSALPPSSINTSFTSIFKNFKDEILNVISSLMDDDDPQKALNASTTTINRRPYDIINKSPVCQVPPMNKFFSEKLSDPKLFQIDSNYFKQWKDNGKTDKIGKTEVESEFYSIFANPKKSFCSRPPSSSRMAYIFGEPKQVIANKRIVFDQYNPFHPYVKLANTSTSSSVITKSSNINAYIVKLEGLRLDLEVLKAGEIDRFNNLITKDFLRSHMQGIDYDVDGTCGIESESDFESVFRVSIINGIELQENSIIGILDGEDTSNWHRTKDGFLIVNDIVITNMVFI